MAKISAYRRCIREKSVRRIEQYRLERAGCGLVAEPGQLWGVTYSELISLRTNQIENYALKRWSDETLTLFCFLEGIY